MKAAANTLHSQQTVYVHDIHSRPFETLTESKPLDLAALETSHAAGRALAIALRTSLTAADSNIDRTERTVIEPAKIKLAALRTELEAAERDAARAVSASIQAGRTIESAPPRIEALVAKVLKAEGELRILERSATQQRDARETLAQQVAAADAEVRRRAEAIYEERRLVAARAVFAAHAAFLAAQEQLKALLPDGCDTPNNIEVALPPEVRRALACGDPPRDDLQTPVNLLRGNSAAHH